ncbi:hypothetical protein SAMN04488096_101355 [Mesonia phycicola]|uniref:Sulfotransferase family protein n=1 Tax=Mesonia phycicola TaxID=579105 RepID=A0A1M6AN30_9FLAO|nr:sulfotransferase [Mesonia phycicola]SHI37886.1 hypothetical protein SAMN04488096_101355 [Mesonia phycicola]
MGLLNKNNKIFCIGLNKTGTTSIERVLKGFQFKMGNQEKAELLLKNWYDRDFKSIIKFCKKAEAFQDIPFSLPYTYMFLEQHYPQAKFILTVRDNEEQWYNSITKFHAKLWSDNKLTPPNATELRNAIYRYKGWAFEANQFMFNTDENEPYNKETLIAYYKNHNYQVQRYFESMPDKLLVINVSNSDDYYKLCKFLNKPAQGTDFPWENKTNSR